MVCYVSVPTRTVTSENGAALVTRSKPIRVVLDRLFGLVGLVRTRGEDISSPLMAELRKR